MFGPCLHVPGRIDQPLAHVEHFVALRLVVADIQIQRIADDQRSGIGCEFIADDRVRAGGIARLDLCGCWNAHRDRA
jgi:hypothetical protein